MDPTAVVQTICGTVTSLQHIAPLVAAVWIAAILVAALVLRGPELVFTLIGITIVAMAIMNFQTLMASLGVTMPGAFSSC